VFRDNEMCGKADLPARSADFGHSKVGGEGLVRLRQECGVGIIDEDALKEECSSCG
jgi:hypothetical protein